MTLAELVVEYEQRRHEAQRHCAMAPLAATYGVVLEELRAVDGIAMQDRLMDTVEAASVLSLAPKTVAKWAAAGRFSGAHKTSEAGEWRLPSRAVYDLAGSHPNREATAIPKLWEED